MRCFEIAEAVLCVGFGLSFLVGCDDVDGGPAPEKNKVAQPICGPIKAGNSVAADSPLAVGQDHFLCDSWGTEVLDEWPPADFMLDLMKNEPEIFGDQFSKFGFIPDPKDEFPIGFKRGRVDPTKVKETCAVCHVAKLPNGTLWMGAPNLDLDFARFSVEVEKRWVLAGNPSTMSELAKTKKLQLGPGRTNAESSEYPQLVAADFPAYFDLAKRSHMNYLGTGLNVKTEAYLSIYTFGAGAPNDQVAKVKFPALEKVDEFVAFLGSLPAPPAPPGDATLIEAGKTVFGSAKCGACHHPGSINEDGIVTLDKAPTGTEHFPGDDPSFPRGSIRTDPLHVVISIGDATGSGGDGGTDSGVDTGFQDLIKFIFGHKLKVTFSDGYRALDMAGVWLTPPYLHNGSVPTLEDLLKKPADRPKVFQRGSFSVDTSLPGNTNVGHDFGTDLSEADKTALVAYLKSL